MDVIMLSRIQFAVTVFFHFIFVPLTLGLSMLLVIFQTMYFKTGNDQYKRMTKFWGKLFLINFALGVVTGITMEFQFGTNWSQYSAFMGDIFGALLAIEATMAFFLESTFIAVWHFGWDKVSKRVHLFSIYMVAIAGNLSALWIILANGWMQNPVGYKIINGRAELQDFFAVLSNDFAWSQYIHTVLAAWTLGGFFVLGISAWHLVRKNEKDFFTRSFKVASTFTLICTALLLFQGHHHGMAVARLQPTKLAAMESHWETKSNVPLYLLTFPDAENKKNYFEFLPVPGALSILAFGSSDAEVAGLKDSAKKDFNEFVATTNYNPESPVVELPDGSLITKPISEDTAMPPVALTFLSFRLMATLGILFIILVLGAFIYRKDIAAKPLLAKILPFAIPLPYIAIMAGWMLAEVGRQPWIVNKVMLTSQAVSPVPESSVAISLIAFIIVYALLGSAAIYLLQKFAKKGPEPLE